MKFSLTNSILNILEAGAVTTINMAWAMSTTKSESYRRLQTLKNSSELSQGENIISEIKLSHKEYRKYHALLYRLEKNGLVAHPKDSENNNWAITVRGSSRLEKVRMDPRNKTLVDRDGLTIVSYDIPMKQRRERDRLREILKIAEFKNIHQSLWYSNKMVTIDFLKILKKLRILDSVHIFEVNKSGSLKPVSKSLI